MSSKENLKDALKRSNRKLLELRKENKNLQEEIDILTLRIKVDKIHCKAYHKEKVRFRYRNLQEITLELMEKYNKWKKKQT